MNEPVVVACLVTAAVLLAWPRAARRVRLRQVFGAGPTTRWERWLAWSAARWRELTGAGAGQPLSRHSGPFLSRIPTGGLVAVAGAVAVGAGAAGGPVALSVVATYAVLAVRAAVAKRQRASRLGQRARTLDLLGIAAAELRAGQPVTTALAELATAPEADPLVARARAAVRLAERTGAPLASLIERIELDARNADRAAGVAAAQVAGARATAWLLTALPLAGLGLGYAIGADPLPVLLGSPLGAAAAAGAVVLQLGGLAWTGRITRMAAVTL